MSSASVVDPATVGWNVVFQAIVLPASRMTVPPNEWPVLTQEAQPELVYAWAIEAGCSGLSFKRRSCLLLLIGGFGLLSRQGDVHQK
jgi:hypothetical protein